MIGKSIHTLLTGSGTLTTLLGSNKIFPYVVNEDTDLPYVSYAIDDAQPDYNKGGWAYDDITFSVTSFKADYQNLQPIVTAVRAALELKKIGYSGEEFGHIYMTGLEEGYSLNDGAFYNTLRFKVRLNNY